MCSDLLTHLSIVKDPRSEKNKLYPLEEILLLCICAVVSGAEGWQAITAFGRAKLGWLQQFLPFACAFHARRPPIPGRRRPLIPCEDDRPFQAMAATSRSEATRCLHCYSAGAVDVNFAWRLRMDSPFRLMR